MRSFSVFLILGLLGAAFPKTAGAAPELEALAAKNAAGQATLADASAKQVEAVRARYLQALAAALAEMQRANRGGAVAAIEAEMADAKGEVHGAFPADLPHSLAPARRDFLASLEAIDKAVRARKEELRKQYLVDLSRLSQMAASQRNQALIAAVAKEMAGASPAETAPGVVGLRHNAVINGGFSDGPLNGMPTGWQPKGASFQGDNIPWQNDALLLQEGSEKFLRFRRAASVRLANVSPASPILVPERAKAAVVTARIRVEGLVPGKDYDRFPSVTIRALDATGKSPGGATAAVTENSRWKRVTTRLVLQPGAKTLELIAGPAAAAGVVDFDDIEVKFE